MKVAPSIIAADFSRLRQELNRVEKGRPDLIHLDIMDGVFVPNMTFGPMVVMSINQMTKLPLDAHLMIVKPEQYIKHYIDAGADLVSFHVEAAARPKEIIKYIKSRNKKAGMAISPGTPIGEYSRFFELIDFVLIMSVNPGFYGQKFLPEILKKIVHAKDLIARNRLSCTIEVDGGIHAGNVMKLKSAGADIVVSGAGIFKTRNYSRAIRALKCLKD